MGNSIDSQG